MADFTRRISSLFTNSYKTGIALIACTIALFAFNGWDFPPQKQAIAFLVSGVLGLGIGDIFLLKAFSMIGPGRTLMIFGFHPLFVSFIGYFVFNQPLGGTRLLPIALFLGCLFFSSLEKMKEEGRWNFKGFLFGFIGVMLDASGTLFTRLGFEGEELHPLLSHWLRCLSALTVFLILNAVTKTPIIAPFKEFSKKDKMTFLFACFLGTFLSLWFHLTALRTGHLATISAISITGPIFITIIESFRARKLPTKYSIVALILFSVGFLILTTSEL